MNIDVSKYNVLFVDDEIQVLKAIKRGVHLEKYNKFFALSGKEALKIVDEKDISLIVTDMKMPEMDGLKLLKEVHERDNRIIKIILSGYMNSTQIIATINSLNIYKFILKPWDLKSELKPLIISGLNKYVSEEDNQINIKVVENKNELFRKLVSENKNSLLNIENDFKKVSKLNKMALNYCYFLGLLLKDGKLSTLRFKEELNFVEEFISSYIGKLPRKGFNFDLSIIKKKVEKRLMHRNAKNNDKHPILEVIDKINDNTKLKEIDMNILYLFIILIVENFYNINNDSIIKFLVSYKDDNIILILKFDSIKDVDDTRNNTLYIMLNTLADMMNVKLKLNLKKENRRIITLVKRIENEED